MSTTQTRIGLNILDIITSGMYNDSKMVIREYVQNACDSIDRDSTNSKSDSNTYYVKINLDHRNRNLTIEDNGCGMSSIDASSILTSIAISTKTALTDRGFRGIGRLGGIAYAEQLIFETKTRDSDKITKVTWNKSKLDLADPLLKSKNIDEIIPCIVSVENTTCANKSTDHFFRVTLVNIKKFHNDDLMNTKILSKYLTETAPVPYDVSIFNYAEEINTHLQSLDGKKDYNIYINDSKIFKSYTNDIFLRKNLNDRISKINNFTFYNSNKQIIAKGWYASLSFLSALPPKESYRGIRYRQGNIAIGDEYTLSNYFTENRFSSWHIGEIHVNYNIQLNARRDGFEHSTNYQSLIEQSKLLCTHLSHLCRKASKERSSSERIQNIFSEVEGFLKQYYFFDVPTVESLITSYINQLTQFLSSALTFDEDTKAKTLIISLNDIKKNNISLTSIIDGRSVRHMDQKELLQDIIHRISINYNKHPTLPDFIEAIIAPYIKDKKNG